MIILKNLNINLNFWFFKIKIIANRNINNIKFKNILYIYIYKIIMFRKQIKKYLDEIKTHCLNVYLIFIPYKF